MEEAAPTVAQHLLQDFKNIDIKDSKCLILIKKFFICIMVLIFLMSVTVYLSVIFVDHFEDNVIVKTFIQKINNTV